jgi:hypothetical protein
MRSGSALSDAPVTQLKLIDTTSLSSGIVIVDYRIST